MRTAVVQFDQIYRGQRAPRKHTTPKWPMARSTRDVILARRDDVDETTSGTRRIASHRYLSYTFCLTCCSSTEPDDPTGDISIGFVD